MPQPEDAARAIKPYLLAMETPKNAGARTSTVIVTESAVGHLGIPSMPIGNECTVGRISATAWSPPGIS